MPPSAVKIDTDSFNCAYIAYDTSRIRKDLEYKEIVPEQEAMLANVASKTID
jgi:hypothetical protein